MWIRTKLIYETFKTLVVCILCIWGSFALAVQSGQEAILSPLYPYVSLFFSVIFSVLTILSVTVTVNDLAEKRRTWQQIREQPYHVTVLQQL